MTRLNHTQLLRYAGLFTWAMVGIPLLLNAWHYPAGVGADAALTLDLALWGMAYLGFGLGYWAVTRRLGARRARWFDLALLALITLSAIAVSHFSGTGLGGVLLLIVAGVLPWLLPLPIGIAWLVLQHVALVPVFTQGQGFSLFAAILQSALYVGYSSFTFVTGLVAKQQAEARDEQRRLNAELRATRALLAESSRLSERMRISRELHDLLGHHLTALSLNLEVASHLSEGKSREHVQQAQALAKLLLTDVREAVSQLRDEGAVDLTLALRSLAEGVPGLDVRRCGWKIPSGRIYCCAARRRSSPMPSSTPAPADWCCGFPATMACSSCTHAMTDVAPRRSAPAMACAACASDWPRLAGRWSGRPARGRDFRWISICRWGARHDSGFTGR